jgi:hypothetical protein
MRRRTKIILAVIGVAIVWPFAQIGLIAAQAQYFTNGRPYCIETSGGRFGQYKPVGSLLELNGITLHAPYVDVSGSMGSRSLLSMPCLPSTPEAQRNGAIGRTGINILIG